MSDMQRKVVNKKALDCIEDWIAVGYSLMEISDSVQLFQYISEVSELGDPIISKSVDQAMKASPGIEFEHIREKLLVHLVAKKIAHYYKKESYHKRCDGTASDKKRLFFDMVTEEPQVMYDLLDICDVSENTVKNVGRHDPFPERGRVRFKTNKLTKERFVYREKK